MGKENKEFNYKKAKDCMNNTKNVVVAFDLNSALKYKNKKILILLEQYKGNIGLMKLFSEKKSAFLIDLGRIIQNNGFKRAYELAVIRRFLSVCIKYKLRFALAHFPKDEFSARSEKELVHISFLVGLNPGQAKFGIENFKSNFLL